jgi:hypothetical protein
MTHVINVDKNVHLINTKHHECGYDIYVATFEVKVKAR